MYGKVREVEAAETGNCSILDDKPIRLNLGETRKDTDQICQLIFTHYGVQGHIEFHPMPMSVFPQSGYLLQGEIGCEGSSAVMGRKSFLYFRQVRAILGDFAVLEGSWS
jgi:hypothetical protein